MRYLMPSTDKEIIIKPRWPYKKVVISENAFSALMRAQGHLTQNDIRLVLTRGYEYEKPFLKWLHKLIRLLSACLFCIVYPHRYNECREILSANGHDRNGDNIDISIVHNRTLIGLLPYGAFTSRKTIIRMQKQHHPLLSSVRQALELAGFVIHANNTEAMQIHCHLPIKGVKS